MRFVFLTTQDSYTPALHEAAALVRREFGLDASVGVYIAASLQSEAAWQRLERDLGQADVIFGAMLFGEQLVRPLEKLLAQVQCPVCIVMSNPALVRYTHLGKFALGGQRETEKDEAEAHGMRKWMQAFKPRHGKGEAVRMLNIIHGMSRMLKYLPGRFRDVHTYIAAHQFWMNNTPLNLKRLLLLLAERYIPGYKGRLPVEEPQIYPELAIVHPDAPQPFDDLKSYQKWRSKHFRGKPSIGSIGLLSLRVIVLGGNIGHLNALVRALEARGVEA
nr:DUF3479 domain-containing protein [Chloroflexaceae bacterium]